MCDGGSVYNELMPVKYLSENSLNRNSDAKKPDKSKSPFAFISAMFQRKPQSTVSKSSVSSYQPEIEKELYPAKVANRQRVQGFARGMIVIAGIIVLLILANITGAFSLITNAIQSQVSPRGALVVTSEFLKSEVYLGDRKLGETPLEVNSIVTGEYTLTLRAVDNKNDFFIPLEIPITVNPSNTTVVKAQIGPTRDTSSYITVASTDATSASPFKLLVSSVPGDSRIVLDGQEIGYTPLSQAEITNGTKKIVISKEGHRDIEIELNIDEAKVITVTSRLYKYVLGSE